MSHPSLQIYHKDTYPAIDPSRPELSQAGKTVIVAGGSTGIGFGISRGFALAHASRVIILGRRLDVVKDAASKIQQEVGSSTEVEGRAVDISSIEQIRKLWSNLATEGVYVDVLVLSAAAYGKSAPILEMGSEAAWADFETNVRSPLYLAEGFYKQKTGTGQKVSHIMFLQFLQSPSAPCRRNDYQFAPTDSVTVPCQYFYHRGLHVDFHGSRASNLRPH